MMIQLVIEEFGVGLLISIQINRAFHQQVIIKSFSFEVKRLTKEKADDTVDQWVITSP